MGTERMEPLRPRLEEVRQRLGIRWEVLERDYLLSWVLAGIGTVPELRETLVFKGGTALKKCYFGDYRFSEDLDFTGWEGVPAGDEMEELMSRACESAQELVGEYAPVELLCGRYTESNPHPGGQEAFRIRARLPWHRAIGYSGQGRGHDGRADPLAGGTAGSHARVRGAVAS